MEVRDGVRKFSLAMERKLRANDFKGGWKDCTLAFLEGRMKEELLEYLESSGDVDELPDIANFCMMVWTRRTGTGTYK